MNYDTAAASLSRRHRREWIAPPGGAAPLPLAAESLACYRGARERDGHHDFLADEPRHETHRGWDEIPRLRTASLRKNSVIAPLDIKFSRPSAHRQISTFAHQRAQTGMSAARERKIARFFLHAATRWHSARYVRFKRNSRKFLQNFFAKNLVCVPKVRTFALAKQK